MKYLAIILTTLVVASCSILKTNKSKTDTIWVNSEKVDCTDVSPMECMQVQFAESPGDEWQNFYSQINGFTFEEGYVYKLEITQTKLPKEEVPADASNIRYDLVKVLEKTPDLKEEGIYAYIQTNKGDIVGKLAMDKAPLTVANFVGLAEGKLPNKARAMGVPYFDSLTFHRVIPNFMIQGGDPNGMGNGGPGYKFKNETHPDLKHDKAGVFSMANAGPNTNGSQFFITHKPTPYLDGNYNVFGQVVLGQDVVVAIGNVARNGADKPKSTVYMEKVRIIRIGKAAQEFNAVETFNKLR